MNHLLDDTSNIAVIGAAGGIGQALLSALLQNSVKHIYAFTRTEFDIQSSAITRIAMDITDEASIINATAMLPKNTQFDLIVVCTGILHDEIIKPEKNINALNQKNLMHYFLVNTIGPTLVAKHLMPLLSRGHKSIFALLSARVASISDNRSGGWYGYRASKAALNMIIKNLAIENKRINPDAVIVGLHPGTVDTKLSKPFQENVPAKQLFTPQYSVNALLNVINSLSVEDSGFCFDWAGEQIEP